MLSRRPRCSQLWQVSQLEELTREKAEEMEAVRAELGESIQGKEKEVERVVRELFELRAQRKTMAMSLAHYATLEVQWSTERDENTQKIRRLSQEVKVLRKKAVRRRFERLPSERLIATQGAPNPTQVARVGAPAPPLPHSSGRSCSQAKVESLQRKVEDSSHEDLVQTRAEAKQLAARVMLLEGELASLSQEKASLASEVDDHRAAASAADWLAQEEQGGRVAQLEAQATRLKEGLTRRVVRQWTLRGATRCWKAWGLYVMRRRLNREIVLHGGEPLSGDEGDESSFNAD